MAPTTGVATGVAPGVATSAATSSPTASPGPSSRAVTSIVVVAAFDDGANAAESASALVWNGAQHAATTLGVPATLVSPTSAIELAGKVDAAAAGGATIVIAVGRDASAQAAASAAGHPETQFLMVDVATPAGAPANLRGLVFDEAQAGYLAGIVASAYSRTGHVAMVGDSATDARSQNYLAGFRAGVREGNPGATVAVGYAGSATALEAARTATAALVKSGSDVVLAMPGLSGIGAMREACARHAFVLAADTDAWQLVPDVRPCLIAGVRKRYDLVVSAAILAYASGAPVQTTTMSDVASRGIELTDLHVAAPTGLQVRLDSALAVMRAS